MLIVPNKDFFIGTYTDSCLLLDSAIETVSISFTCCIASAGPIRCLRFSEWCPDVRCYPFSAALFCLGR